MSEEPGFTEETLQAGWDVASIRKVQAVRVMPLHEGMP